MVSQPISQHIVLTGGRLGKRPGHNGITTSCSSGTALPLAEVYLGWPAGTTRDLAVLSNCRFQQEG
jgi:hypothetical protein